MVAKKWKTLQCPRSDEQNTVCPYREYHSATRRTRATRAAGARHSVDEPNNVALNESNQEQKANMAHFCCCFLVAKLCQLFCHPVDCSPPGYGITQARILQLYLNKMSKLGKAVEEKVVPPKKKDFPDGPVAQTPHSKCRGSGSIPGRGTTFHML